MNKIFIYLSKLPFWVNLLAAVAFVFLIGYLFLQSLSWFTNHGDHLKVPPVKGQNVDNAIKLLESKGFEVIIQDSLYFDSIPRYTVIKQLPEPDATVKVNRTVFLTINRAAPPAINMPKLEGLSFRFAYDLLQRNHLKLGDTIYRPDFMKGSVLEQQYNGSRIAAGTKVPWGARVTLIIGGGLEVQQMLVPNLMGLSFAEAKALLETKGGVVVKKINEGAINDQTRMRDGFIITKANGKTVKSVDELRSIIGASKDVKIEGIYPGYEETFEYPLDLGDSK